MTQLYPPTTAADTAHAKASAAKRLRSNGILGSGLIPQQIQRISAISITASKPERESGSAGELESGRKPGGNHRKLASKSPERQSR
jgi:hypothetical protein